MASLCVVLHMCVCVCAYLHSNHSEYKEQHENEQGYIRKSLKQEITLTDNNPNNNYKLQAVVAMLTWRDFMKVHRRFRIPSERFRSFTRRMTRNSLKNVTDTLMFSEDFSERKVESERERNWTSHSVNHLIQNKRKDKVTHRYGLHGIHFLQKQLLFFSIAANTLLYIIKTFI